MLTIINKSRMNLDQVAAKAIESFDIDCTIEKISKDTLSTDHIFYYGTYVFTGLLFSKINYKEQHATE